eukprot:TRINITY_DN6889_c1_g2_i4.p1 TRINITY_DN6889_c1_g2~~TRINITY_DN6889_c1_g2_i4.p1  ORF type:complete len:663 (-),score=65.45 TRINITY_DN6889_c1_g2_i4:303-2291(-)
MLLYKAIVLKEGGDLAGSLKCLEDNIRKIRDKTGYLQIKAEILLELNQMNDAAIATKQLVESQPENYDFHHRLCRSLGFDGKMRDEEARLQLIKVYDSLQDQYPRSAACRRIPLEFLQGEEFRQAVDSYVRRFLLKGIPSLFRDLKPLYKDSAKSNILCELFRYYLNSLEETGRLPPLLQDNKQQQYSSDDSFESPQAVVWVLMYLAQAYDELGETQKALECLDAIQAHTPTLIELYSIRSQVLHNAGDLKGAAYFADLAQEMDLADRNLNSFAVQQNFSAGNAERAEKLSTLFTKEMGVQSTLYEMQCIWYEIAAGKCYMQLEKYGLALKNLRYVSKHFEDFREDQFDFHQYCVRKMTLRAYLGMLRFEDTIYANNFFFEAACLAIECYLKLYDDPKLAEYEIAYIQKEAKAKQKKEAVAQKKKDAAKSSKSKEEVKHEDDLVEEQLGLKYLKEDPLKQSVHLLSFLRQSNSDKIRTHCLSFQVYWRKEKICLCLQALKAVQRLAGTVHPLAHTMLIKLATKVEKWSTQEDLTLAQEIVSLEIKKILWEDMTAYNQRYLQEHCQHSLRNTIAACQVMYDLDAHNRGAAAKFLLENFDNFRHEKEEFEAAHKLLLQMGCLQEPYEWKKKCQKIFRWSNYFEGDAIWKNNSDGNNGKQYNEIK